MILSNIWLKLTAHIRQISLIFILSFFFFISTTVEAITPLSAMPLGTAIQITSPGGNVYKLIKMSSPATGSTYWYLAGNYCEFAGSNCDTSTQTKWNPSPINSRSNNWVTMLTNSGSIACSATGPLNTFYNSFPSTIGTLPKASAVIDYPYDMKAVLNNTGTSATTEGSCYLTTSSNTNLTNCTYTTKIALPSYKEWHNGLFGSAHQPPTGSPAQAYCQTVFGTTCQTAPTAVSYWTRSPLNSDQNSVWNFKLGSNASSTAFNNANSTGTKVMPSLWLSQYLANCSGGSGTLADPYNVDCTTAPTLNAITSPAVGVYRSAITGFTDLNLISSVSDPDNNNQTIQYQIDSGTWQTLGSVTGLTGGNTQSFNLSLNVSGLTAGAHAIVLRSYDGYFYSNTQSLVFNIDKSAPTCTGWNPSTSTWTNGATGATFTPTGCADLGGSGLSVTNSCTTALTNGATCNVTITDNVGNATTYTSPSNKVDSGAPTVSATGAGPGWTNLQKNGVVTATDSLSGLAEIRYSWNVNNLGSACTGGIVIANGASVTAPNGASVLYLCAKDNAGNVAINQGNYYWEDQIPTCTGWNPTTSVWHNSSSTSTFTPAGCSDTGGSGLVAITNCTTSNVNGATCNVTVSDHAGNSVVLISPTNNIDSLSPIVSATGAGASWTNIQKIAVIESYDAVATLTSGESGIMETRYSWNNNDLGAACTGGTVTTSGSTLLAPAGGATLYLCAKDNAGNIITNKGVYNWENIAPTCTGWSPAEGDWHNSATGTTFTPTGCTDNGGSILIAPTNCTTAGINDATCSITVSDNAGNSSIYTSPPNRITTLGPTISITNSSPNWFNYLRNSTITVTPSPAGLVETRYSWNVNDLNSSCTVGTIINTGDTIDSPTGGSTLYVCARDTAGNITNITGIFNWEDIAPTCSSWNPVISPWSNVVGTTDFVLTNCTDNGGSNLASTGNCTTGSNYGDTCQASVTDHAGNTNVYTSPINRYDLIAPLISASGAGSDWTNTPKTVIISASDDLSGLAEIRYSWNENNLGASCNGGSLTNNGDSLTSPTGGATLYLCARDNAGNISFNQGNYNWEDTTPTCSSWDPTIGQWTSVHVPTTFLPTGCTDTGGSQLKTVLACETGLDNGNTCQVTVSDYAGNSNTYTSPPNRVDSLAPTVSATGAGPNWSNVVKTALVIAADQPANSTSDISEIAEIRYSWNTNDLGLDCNSGGVITTSGASLVAPAGGATLYLCARDIAGNTAINQGEYNWESTAPNCTGWSPAIAPWQNGSTGTVFTPTGCSDLGGSNLIPPTDCTTGVNNGDTCQVTISDNAGNASNYTSPEHRLDIIAPLISASGAGSSWGNSFKIAQISASDSLSGLAEIRYSWNDNNLGVNCTGGTLSSNSGYVGAPVNGAILYLCARDNAGNVSFNQGEYNWENTSPIVSASNADINWRFAPLSAVISAIDALPGSDISRLRTAVVSNGLASPFDANCTTGGNPGLPGDTININIEGDYTLYLCVADNANNIGTWNGSYRWYLPEPIVSATNSNSNNWSASPISTVIAAISTNSAIVETRYLFSEIDMNSLGANCDSGGTILANNPEIIITPEGHQSLYLCTRDTNGQVGTWSGVFQWSDNQPTVTAANSNPGQWSATALTAQVQAQSTAGIVEIRSVWDIQPASFLSDCAGDGAIIVNNDILNSAINSHTLFLCARDNTGRVANWTGIYQWDNLAPTISQTTVGGVLNEISNIWTTEPTILLTATDSGGSGVQGIRYSWDALFTDIDPAPTYLPGSEQTISLPGNGAHILYYQTIDVARNYSAVLSYSIELDTLAPIISTTYSNSGQIGENGWYVEAPTLKTLVIDTSDIKGLYRDQVASTYDSQYVPTNFHDFSAQTDHGQWFIEMTPGAGITTDYYYAQDDADNISALGHTNFKVDLDQPTATLVYTDGAQVNSSQLSLSMSSSDSTSGINTCQLSVAIENDQSGTFNNWQTILTTCDSSFTYQMQRGKFYRFKLLVKDFSGRQNEVSPIQISSFNPPNSYITASGADIGVWTNTAPQPTILAANNSGAVSISEIRYQWQNNFSDQNCDNNSGSNAVANYSSLTDVPQGQNTLYLCARDSEDRVVTWSGIYQWENIAPEVSADMISNQWQSAALHPTVNLNEMGGSGINHTLMAITSYGQSSPLNSLCSAGGSFVNQGEVLNPPEGSSTIHLCTIDLAGNIGTWSGDYLWTQTNPIAIATNSNLDIDYWSNASLFTTMNYLSYFSPVVEARYAFTGAGDNSPFDLSCTTGGQNYTQGMQKNTTFGTQKLHLCVRNEAGLVGTWSGLYQWDDAAPQVSATQSDSYTWYSEARQPILSFTDQLDGSGIANTRAAFVSQGQGSPFNTDCTSGGNSVVGGQILSSPVGAQTLYLCAVDRAGNISTWNGNYQWAPSDLSITATLADASNWYNSIRQPVINYIANAGGATISSARYAFTSLNQSNPLSVDCNSGGSLLSSNGQVLSAPSGASQLYLCAKDVAGGTSHWSGIYQWESLAPLISSDNGNQDIWFNPDLSTQIAMADPNPTSGFVRGRYLWDSNDFGLDCSLGQDIGLGITSLSVPAGSHQLNICAIDQAYNISLASFTYEVKYTIQANTNNNLGTITPAGSSFYLPGDQRSFSIHPNAGSQLDSLIIDGVTISPNQTYTFNDIQENHSITANFSAISTPVITPAPSFTLSEPTSGSVSAPGCAAAKPGNQAPYVTGVTAVSPTQVRINFNAGDAPFDHFLISYGLTPDQLQYGTVLNDVQARTAQISDLQPGTKYYFRIMAANNCAVGTWSNMVSANSPTIELDKMVKNQDFGKISKTDDLDNLLKKEDEKAEEQAISTAMQINENNPTSNVLTKQTKLPTSGRSVLNWLWFLLLIPFLLFFILRRHRIYGQVRSKATAIYLYDLIPVKGKIDIYRLKFAQKVEIDEKKKYVVFTGGAGFYQVSTELLDTTNLVKRVNNPVELTFWHRTERYDLT